MNNASPYLKFGLMMTASFLIMYAVMFLNVAAADHIMLSLNRTYMSLLMVLPMAVVMLAFMGSMYKNRAANIGILAGATAAFALSLLLLRSQTPVGDIQYMKGMIPHHSSAIMTSRNARLTDPETRALARSIIESQEREIAEMKALIRRLETQPAR